MHLPPGDQLGRYEIVDLLGEGSMGEVYRARDLRLGRDVALKVLRPELAADPERLGRFEREARAASALNHPNVVSLFDVGEHEGAPYLVTELLEGETLRDRCGRGRIPLSEALSIAAQIVEGLDAAHSKGIVHRDLKPENVFLLPGGRVKVLDFGLAKLLEGEDGTGPGENIVVTTAGTVLGTVEYMAPEQMRGQAADHRADLYSLGAVIFEMLAGHTPFQRKTSTETFQAILEEDPPALSKSGVKVPSGIEAALRRSLAKRPEERFASATEFGAALIAVPVGAGSSADAGSGSGSGAAKWIAIGVGLIAVAAAAFFLLRG